MGNMMRKSLVIRRSPLHGAHLDQKDFWMIQCATDARQPKNGFSSLIGKYGRAIPPMSKLRMVTGLGSKASICSR